MKEFKFRVWEVSTKKMVYLGELFCWEHGYHNHNFTNFHDSISDIHIDVFSDKNEVWHKQSKERFILQQFTGLKDKNEKDIYEGDIVYQGKNYPNYIVEYNDRIGAFTASGLPFNLNVGRFICSNSLEVIGNIFENLELIRNNKYNE